MPKILNLLSSNIYYLLIGILSLAAFLERTVFDLGPNIELITTSMILISYYFGKKAAFPIIFIIVALSDRFIGNSSIFLFTWSGFLIPALFGSNIIKIISHKLFKDYRNNLRVIPLLSLGIISNIFFYLWTNFGVWFFDTFNMYPNGLSGLFLSYINGLPFLRNQFISTLIFLPAIFTLFEATVDILKIHNFRLIRRYIAQQ